MENELFLLSVELRAVAHILRYSDYIRSVTGDDEFHEGLADVLSAYFYGRSEYCLNAISDSFESNEKEWNRTAIQLFVQQSAALWKWRSAVAKEHQIPPCRYRWLHRAYVRYRTA